MQLLLLLSHQYCIIAMCNQSLSIGCGACRLFSIMSAFVVHEDNSELSLFVGNHLSLWTKYVDEM